MGRLQDSFQLLTITPLAVSHLGMCARGHGCTSVIRADSETTAGIGTGSCRAWCSSSYMLDIFGFLYKNSVLVWGLARVMTSSLVG